MRALPVHLRQVREVGGSQSSEHRIPAVRENDPVIGGSTDA